MREVFEVTLNIGAGANASHGGNESDGGVGLNHLMLLMYCLDSNHQQLQNSTGITVESRKTQLRSGIWYHTAMLSKNSPLGSQESDVS